jgi:hypothetical protein
MMLKIKKLQALAKQLNVPHANGIDPMLMKYSLKQGVSYKYGPFGTPWLCTKCAKHPHASIYLLSSYQVHYPLTHQNSVSCPCTI